MIISINRAVIIITIIKARVIRDILIFRDIRIMRDVWDIRVILVIRVIRPMQLRLLELLDFIRVIIIRTISVHLGY
jgi:hypothetical protein